MPLIKPINYEQSLINEYKNTKYFCPHCRLLFKDIHNDHKIQEKCDGYNYQCPQCKKCFNRSTYGDKRKSGKKYKIGETINKTTDEYIKSHIKNLWNEGYTNREIHTITLFSRTRIGQITKEFRNNIIDICSIEEFDKNYLSDLDNKYPLMPWRDLRTHKIRKAFSTGCSVSQISKILNIGNTTIVEAKSGNYLAENKKNSLHHSIDPSKKKILTKEESKFSKEAEEFLANAEPPITHKKSNNKNHTRITISPEDEQVRIYGISDRKKVNTPSPHTT
jgi:transposase-like protein